MRSGVGISAKGCAIESLWFHVFDLQDSFFASGFQEVTLYWKHIGVLFECGVELQMVLTYLARDVRDLKSGWWVVACTAFAGKVVKSLVVQV